MTSEMLTEKEFDLYIFKCLCFTHKIKENECNTYNVHKVLAAWMKREYEEVDSPGTMYLFFPDTTLWEKYNISNTDVIYKLLSSIPEVHEELEKLEPHNYIGKVTANVQKCIVYLIETRFGDYYPIREQAYNYITTFDEFKEIMEFVIDICCNTKVIEHNDEIKDQVLDDIKVNMEKYEDEQLIQYRKDILKREEKLKLKDEKKREKEKDAFTYYEKYGITKHEKKMEKLRRSVVSMTGKSKEERMACVYELDILDTFTIVPDESEECDNFIKQMCSDIIQICGMNKSVFNSDTKK